MVESAVRAQWCGIVQTKAKGLAYIVDEGRELLICLSARLILGHDLGDGIEDNHALGVQTLCEAGQRGPDCFLTEVGHHTLPQHKSREAGIKAVSSELIERCLGLEVTACVGGRIDGVARECCESLALDGLGSRVVHLKEAHARSSETGSTGVQASPKNHYLRGLSIVDQIV